MAVESLGPLADDTHRFITEIGRRMTFSEKRRSCIPTHLSGDSTLQRRVSCKHFHFRSVLVIPDIIIFVIIIVVVIIIIIIIIIIMQS